MSNSRVNGVKATVVRDTREKIAKLPSPARVAMLRAGLEAGIRKANHARMNNELLRNLTDTLALVKAFQTEDPWWSASFTWVSREEPTPDGVTLFATDYESVWTIIGDGKPIPPFAKKVKAWTVARFPLPPLEEDVV